jgi:FlaA1/EpsC-like NDP-sugar epimerase
MNIFEFAAFVGLPSIVALVCLIGMPGCVPIAIGVGFGSAVVSLVVVILSGFVYRLFRGRLPQRAPVPIWAVLAVLLSASAALYLRLHPMEHKSPPNKSPEPTAVGAGSSAVAVHVASRRWLSFFR